MFKDLTEKPLYKWWYLYQSKEQFTFLVQLSLMLGGVLILCSRGFFYKIHEYIETSYTAWAWLGWYLTFGELLISFSLGILVTLKVFNFLSKVEPDGTEHELNKGRYKDTEVVLKSLPAQKAWMHNTAMLKKNIINRAGSKQVVYQIIENDEYFLGSYIFSINSIYRLVALFLGSQMIIASLGFLSKTTVLMAIKTQLATTVYLAIFLLLVDFFISSVAYKRNNLLIKKIAARYSDSKDRVYCETDLIVKPCKKADFYSTSTLVVGGQSLTDLTTLTVKDYSAQDDADRYSIIESVLNNINSVIVTAYKAACAVNNYDSGSQFEIEAEDRRSHVKEILSTIDIYIPSLVKEVKISMKNMENLYLSDKRNKNLQNILTAYSELNEDLLKQKKALDEIISVYKSSFKDNTLSSFRNLIKRRENGWIGDSRFDNYSIKTQVLNKSLNENLIPELEHMMVGASDNEKELLLAQIGKIKAFFNEQVSLDEELRSSKALDYDRSVSINSEKVPLQTVDLIKNKIEQVDMYLNELKKNW